MPADRKQYYDPQETHLWVSNQKRRPEMSRDYMAYWFTRYGFVVLVCFFVALVFSAIAFLPAVRHGNVSNALTEIDVNGSRVPASTISEDKAAVSETKETLLLNVSSEPEGQTVFIDFDSVGVTPLYKLKVATGVYVVSAGFDFATRVDTVVVATDTEPRWIMFGPDNKVTSRRDSPASTFLGSLPDSLNVAADLEPSEAISDNPTPAPTSTNSQSTGSGVLSGVPNTTPVEPEPQRRPAERVQNNTVSSTANTTGNLIFESNPEGAIVLLDEVLVGSTPLTLKGVPTGDHRITIKKNGFDDYSATINVQADESLVVNASLASTIGKLVVLVEPWGSIYIDGKLYKLETDIEYTTDLAAGNHIVTATHPTLGSVSQEVTMQGGDRVRVTLSFNK